MSIYEQEIIGGKRVYIVDDHNKALLPWAMEFRDSNKAFSLITLDHHTDTHRPFIHWIGQQEPDRPYIYVAPKDGIFVVGQHKDADSVADPIEDRHLAKRIEILHEMTSSTGIFQSVFGRNYILDIDLDYFHTMKSIKPQSH